MKPPEPNGFDFDVAISFAGEDRGVAEKIAELLTSLGVRVFYDRYEKANLWGKDLYQHLAKIYSEKARFCLVLISVHYSKKLWPRHELKNAFARAFQENEEYILPLKLDDTTIPGIPQTTGYHDLRQSSIGETVELIMTKLGQPRPRPGLLDRTGISDERRRWMLWLKNPLFVVGLVSVVISLTTIIVISQRFSGPPIKSSAPAATEPSLYNVGPSVTVKPDGRWEIVVPAIEEGVRLTTDNGKEFRVTAGDELEIIATGFVDIGRGAVGPNGEAHYTDPSMDSPIKDRVGGLEMWIGDDKNSNRYFVGAHFEKKVKDTGIPTLRVIESLYGYHDGNLGAFRVVVRKVK